MHKSQATHLKHLSTQDWVQHSLAVLEGSGQ